MEEYSPGWVRGSLQPKGDKRVAKEPMMKRVLYLTIISVAFWNSDADLLTHGVKTTYINQHGKEVTTIVKRQVDTSCQKQFMILA